MPTSNELEFIQKIHGKLLNYIEKSKDRFVRPRNKAEFLQKEFEIDINAPSSLSEMESHIDRYLESSVLVHGKPVFIELNPMWGGHASIHGFGNEKMRTYIAENRKVLEKRIPNIYNFMDRRLYYKKLYEFIHKHISSLKD